MSTQLEPEVDFEEYTVTEHEVTDNLDDLLAVLPPRIRDGIHDLTADGSRGSLIEIVMDLGRKAEARFQDAEYDIGDKDVTRDEIDDPQDLRKVRAALRALLNPRELGEIDALLAR